MIGVSGPYARHIKSLFDLSANFLSLLTLKLYKRKKVEKAYWEFLYKVLSIVLLLILEEPKTAVSERITYSRKIEKKNYPWFHIIDYLI